MGFFVYCYFIGLLDFFLDVKVFFGYVNLFDVNWIFVIIIDKGILNGVCVIGYKVYINGFFCIEVMLLIVDGVIVVLWMVECVIKRSYSEVLCVIVRI